MFASSFKEELARPIFAKDIIRRDKPGFAADVLRRQSAVHRLQNPIGNLTIADPHIATRRRELPVGFFVFPPPCPSSAAILAAGN